ncbi:MAG: hypothetical protein V7603_2754 [Micromonosporaceae bacterium]|jgi:hypothetical protein
MKVKPPVRGPRARRPNAVIVIVIVIAQPVILAVCGVNVTAIASITVASAVVLKLVRQLIVVED